jgi:hypothetical protein
MDLAGEQFQVEDRYKVKLPPGDHLTIVAGAHFGEPAYNFDHPDIAAKKSEVFEFRHSRRNGSKFCTCKAGISFYFVLPKAQIELLPEKGYSYVPVLIQGRKCYLNVGGGTSDSGWTDVVGSVAEIGCGWKASALRSLGQIALSPGECRRRGITMGIIALDDRGRQWFAQTAAAVVVRAGLPEGRQVFLREGFSHCGSQGPFQVLSRAHRKQYFICQGFPSHVRVRYSAIDWGRTAEINDIAVTEPVLVNRIGQAVEPMLA